MHDYGYWVSPLYVHAWTIGLADAEGNDVIPGKVEQVGAGVHLLYSDVNNVVYYKYNDCKHYRLLKGKYHKIVWVLFDIFDRSRSR